MDDMHADDMHADDMVARLRELDTCAVSDALDSLGISGAVTGILPLVTERAVAGRVVTLRLAPPGEQDRQPGGTPRRHLGTAAVAASGPGDVIVVAHQGRTDCAGWGGLLSRAAAIRGIEGVVVDGAARDLAEAAAAGLPVYARAATPVTARGRAVEVSWGQPAEVGGIPVRPGDLILADTSGVVVIPAGRAAQVLATAERVAATEAAMAAAIDAGLPVTEVMGKAYEELAGVAPQQSPRVTGMTGGS